MQQHCTNPQELARFSDADMRAENKAEWTAGEHRAGDHPNAHVHYNQPDGAFTVVSPRERA